MMDEAFGLFVALAIGLVLVTLVGLGIWSLVAWLVRAGRSADRRQSPRAAVRHCPFCNCRQEFPAPCCQWCGRPLDGEFADRFRALENGLHGLRDLHSQGVLSESEATDLSQRVMKLRKKLLAPRAVPRAEPSPPPLTPAAEKASPAAPPVPPLPAAAPVVPSQTPLDAQLLVPAAIPAAPQTPVPAVTAGDVARTRRMPATEEPLPAAPRKSWAELINEFMEPHNIRWGELIGGLLFVVGAAALVITQWETLQHFRYFRFLIASAISAGVFGLGWYSHDRWKLRFTGRGLLTVATLLVPLNFLNLAGLAKDDPCWLTLTLTVAALALFGALLALSGRILVPGGRWFEAFALLAISVMVLWAARRFDAHTAPALLVLAGCLPVATYAGAAGGYTYRAVRRRWPADRSLSRWKTLSLGRAAGAFQIAGTTAFALCLALGVLVFRAAGPAGLGRAVECLAVPVALAAAVTLSLGLTIMRQLRARPAAEPYRLAGMWIAFVGGLCMVGALGMAWPRPEVMLPVALFSAATLAAAAITFALPVLHGGAIACALVAFLAGYGLCSGELLGLPRPQLDVAMLHLALNARTGTALVGLFALLTAASELFTRWHRALDSRAYAFGAGAVALLSLLLVTRDSSGHALRTALVYGIYGLGGLAANLRLRRPWLSYASLALLVGATGWELGQATAQVGSGWAGVFAAESLLMGLVAAVLLHPRRSLRIPRVGWTWAPAPLREAYGLPLAHAAAACSLGAFGLGLLMAACEISGTVAIGGPWLIVAAGCLVALHLLLAWMDRTPEWTWGASTVAALGLLYCLVVYFAGRVTQPWPVALLAHASAAGAAAWGLSQFLRRGTDAQRWSATKMGLSPSARTRLAAWADDLRHVYVHPLAGSTLISSAAAVAAMIVFPWQSSYAVAGCLLWLSVIWLAVAWVKRWPIVFAAHQVALAAAVGVAIYARYAGLWAWDRPVNLLQAWGIGAALLSLAWVGVRIAVRRDPIMRQLLNPGWPAVDQIVKHAAVWLQLLVILPGITELAARELLRVVAASNWPPELVNLTGPGAWYLLGVLAATLVASLWERWQSEMLDSLLLATTVPCLIAGRFAADLAMASALRWGLAVTFVTCSAAVWQRGRLAAAMRAIRARVRLRGGDLVARPAILVLMLLPVLVLTLAAALQQLTVGRLGGPTAGVFTRISPAVSYVVPLVLLALGLVGHALRERSTGYLFSAGLMGELAVGLAYPLMLSTHGRSMGELEFVAWIQMITVTAALWVGATVGLWASASTSLRIEWALWAEVLDRNRSRTLMSVQLGFAYFGNALCLGFALLVLLFDPRSIEPCLLAAGSWLAWAALGLTAAAATARTLQAGRRPSFHAAGLLGMALVTLLACTIHNYFPAWGARTLMLGGAGYALAITAAAWWAASSLAEPDVQNLRQKLFSAAAVWVRIAGIAALLLGLKAAGVYEEQLWAAAASATASLAGATMAVWRRHEGWAFAAALGVNLAASLVVWHLHYTLPVGQWWITLLQANAMASATVALAWLAARRRLYPLSELSVSSGPLLALQTAAAIYCNLIPVAVYAAWMLGPQDFAADFIPFGRPAGWIALLLAAAATAWYLFQVAPQRLFTVVGGAAVAATALASCATLPLAGQHPLIHVRVFADGTAAAAMLVLAVGWLARNWKIDVRRSGEETEDRRPFFAPADVECCTALLTLLATVFGLRWCGSDPLGPWPLTGAVFASAVVLGLLACWRGKSEYVYASALLICLAASAVWWVQHAEVSLTLVMLNAGCLAGVAALWTLVELLRPGVVPQVPWEDHPTPFAHAAVAAALALLLVCVAIAVAANLGSPTPAAMPAACYLGGSLDWFAIAAVAAALVVSLWDATARFPLLGLYATAVGGVGTSLVMRRLPSDVFCHATAWELSLFVLAAAAAGYVLTQLSGVARQLRISNGPSRFLTGWFPNVQGLLATIAAALGTWIALDAQFEHAFDPLLYPLPGRIAAALAVACLVPAAAVMAQLSAGRQPAAWQSATLGLAALALAALGWAWLAPSMPLVWLHRTVILMMAAALTAAVAVLGVLRLLPAGNDWNAAVRRAAVWLAGLAVAALAAVLLQEVVCYPPGGQMPLAWWAIASVALVLLAMFAGCIAVAVAPQQIALHPTLAQRKAWVYAAETLLAILALHVRLAMPWLFHLGIIEKYGEFLVMALAFLWVGLSELFRRRKLEALSEPLETTARWLPLLPMVLFFQFGPRTPLVWFLIGLFYAVLAVSRRSFWMGLAAVFTANMGLWVLWYQHELGFFAHPQLWLIPLAMAALVAEYFSRTRLPAGQSSAIRYLSLSVIYLSSSADMFIAGIGNNMGLPLVLLVLSLAGILLGMALRLRSFVYLGTAFLLMDVATLVKYVSIDLHQTWVFWLCIILLGAAIIALFALFEKRRNEIRQALERFRAWKG